MIGQYLPQFSLVWPIRISAVNWPGPGIVLILAMVIRQRQSPSLVTAFGIVCASCPIDRNRSGFAALWAEMADLMICVRLIGAGSLALLQSSEAGAVKRAPLCFRRMAIRADRLRTAILKREGDLFPASSGPRRWRRKRTEPACDRFPKPPSVQHAISVNVSAQSNFAARRLNTDRECRCMPKTDGSRLPARDATGMSGTASILDDAAPEFCGSEPVSTDAAL